MRFDGVRFVDANAYPEGSLADWRIQAVLPAADGSLWIGAGSHVAQIRNGHLTDHAVQGRVNKLVEDAHGKVWFVKTRTGTNGEALCSVDASTVRCYGPPEMPYRSASVLQVADQDALWVGSSRGLCHWKDRIDRRLLPRANARAARRPRRRDIGGDVP